MYKKMLVPLLAIAACALSPASFADTNTGKFDSALLDLSQKKKPDLLKDLATLVNIDSGTDYAEGLSKVEAFLTQRLKELGAEVETAPSTPAVGNMVVGTLRGTGTKNFMLMIHYDTVFGVGEAAKRPFRIEGNKAYGPGVADAKGGALLILHALAIARERGMNNYKTLTVLFNADEEKSSLGSRDMIKKLSVLQDYVFIYEPPEADRVTISTNGIAYVHLSVKGLASHAGSAPEKGHNAAVELSNQIMQLNNLGDPAKGTTVNWTVIKAGEKVNVIPDAASATADMRMSDVSEVERVQQDADRISQKKFIPQTEVAIKVENRRPPFSKNPNSDNLAVLADKIYRELGKKIEPVGMRYGTDAGYVYSVYNPKTGKPVVLDGMGVIGDGIHGVNEWADLDSISSRLYLTVRMLETLAAK